MINITNEHYNSSINRIKNKTDTSSNWTTNNPILLKGEIGIESNTNKFKFGDGIKTWNQLDYSVAGSSNKLTTPKNIALTGAVTGSAEFDGSGNVNIETSTRTAFVASLNSPSNMRWYKVASASLNIVNGDIIGTFFVEDTSSRSDFYGILQAYVMTNNTSEITIKSASLQWLFTGNHADFKLDNYVMVYSTTTHVIELWVKLASAYDSQKFTLISENQKYSRNAPSNIWTLYNTASATGFEAPTEGYTQVPSTYSDLKMGLIQVNKGIYHTGSSYGNATQSAKYVAIVRIKLLHNYADGIIVFKIAQRGTNNYSQVMVRFPGGSTNPDKPNIFTKTGQIDAYLYKSSASTFDLYIKSRVVSDSISLNSIDTVWSSMQGRFEFSYPNQILDALPDEVIEAVYYNPPEIAAQYLKNTGGIVNGSLTLNNQAIQIDSPQNGQVRATVVQRDNKVVWHFNQKKDNKYSDVILSGLASPENPLDATRKEYVDNAISQLQTALVSALEDLGMTVPAKLKNFSLGTHTVITSVPNEAPTLEN